MFILLQYINLYSQLIRIKLFFDMEAFLTYATLCFLKKFRYLQK